MRSSLFLHSLLAFATLFQASCTSVATRWNTEGDEPAIPKRNSYELWQHGARTRERKALAAQFKTKVDGRTTHESEHPIGVKVLLGLEKSDPQRGESREVRSVENLAPAYQEIKALHRKHVGTPRKGAVGDSGFSPDSYRSATRDLLRDQAVSVAIQLNQLGYAFNPAFRGNTAAHQVADASFETMARGMKEFFYYEEGSLKKASLTSEEDRWELLMARHIARTGKWPTDKELAVMKAEISQEDKKKKS